jgi:hypothetical protein
MRNAMDEKERRWQKWRKGMANFLGFDDEGSNVGDDGIRGVKVSMHGRLMVQPSRRVLDIQISDLDGSSDDDEEAAEKKREQMQYRLTAVKGVSRLTLAISVIGCYFMTHDGLLLSPSFLTYLLTFYHPSQSAFTSQQSTAWST